MQRSGSIKDGSATYGISDMRGKVLGVNLPILEDEGAGFVFDARIERGHEISETNGKL